MASHFFMIYSVDCINVGTKIRRKDYCESGVREIVHLKPFEKSVGNDAVALFKIKSKVL